MRFKRWALIALVCAWLYGCVNLSAVRDYSDAAAPVAGNTAPAARWRDQLKITSEFKLDGDVCPTPIKEGLTQGELDAAYEDLEGIHKNLQNYFVALGQLAADELPKIEKSTSSSLDGLAKAGLPIKDDDKNAVNAVAKVLDRLFDAYRHYELREIVSETDAPLRRIFTLLEMSAANYRGSLSGEKVAIIKFLDCERAKKDLSDPYLSRREYKKVNDYYNTEASKIDTYKSALTKIEAKHTELVKSLKANDKKQLELTLKSLSSTAKELRALQQSLEKI